MKASSLDRFRQYRSRRDVRCAAKATTEAVLRDCIEIYATTEGLAVRLATERGAGIFELFAVRRCLGEMERLFVGGTGTARELSDYAVLHRHFHALLRQLSGSPLLIHQFGPDMFPDDPGQLLISGSASWSALAAAQAQRRAIVDAIERGQAETAEALMSEHVRQVFGALLARSSSDSPPQPASGRRSMGK